MPAELPEAAPQAATALIAHLRERPEDASRNPSDLAAEFGLSPGFVRNVLASAGPAVKREHHHFHLDLDLSIARRAGRKVVAVFDKATAEPMPFVAWTTLACVIFVSLVSLAANTVTWRLFARSEVNTFGAILGLSAMFATFLLHMICYFRKAMVRYALQGGLFVWVVLAVVFLVNYWHEQSAHDPRSVFLAQLVLIFVTMIVGSVYAALGSLVTILGGWTRLKIEERQEEQLSRQDLLERYFELQSRLENSADSMVDDPSWSHWRTARFFHRRPIFCSVLIGLSVSLPIALLTALSASRPTGIESAEAFLFEILQATFVLLLVPAYIFIGFFSRGVPEALFNALAGRMAALATVIIPLALEAPPRFGFFLINTVSALLLAWIAQVGSKMQSSAHRSESLRRNDQATVVAEMLRIQWRLSDHRSLICVLSVDAARSSEMKAHADPLAVEYSFREYQDWIDSICKQFGGRVHSTAGDGAVVAFRDCREAFNAARRMQTDLPRFNREDNRLPSPFRLRIGLHVGQVAGDLDEVVFTEVVDIAAHVQAAAPVSGIAVTYDVATALEDQEFIPLAKTVDGHSVSLALNPIED
jgi:class 3 adenylate cyclase